MKKWIQYKSMFYRVGRNMLDAKVFNNEILVEGDGISTVKAMGRAREQELEGRLKLLNLRDFLGEDNMMKSKNEIDLMFGTRTTFVEFFRLRNEIARLKTNIELWRPGLWHTCSPSPAVQVQQYSVCSTQYGICCSSLQCSTLYSVLHVHLYIVSLTRKYTVLLTPL